jgi:RNA polymerase sigma factor for flagellar operon FliA
MLSLLEPAISSLTTPAPKSEETLVQDHVRLVRHIVERVKMTLPAHLDAEDLFGAGLTGLVQAARKFDPSQGTAFASFASARIRGAVLDELRRMDWMSRSCRGKAKRLAETITQLEQKFGREVTEAEVASELSLSGEEYSSLLDEVRPISHVELDAECGEDDGDTTLHDIIADEAQETAADHLMKKEMIQMALARLQRLPDMQKKVLAMYYFEHMRLAEIAAVFGVTESRICQIHTQAVLTLRTHLRTALAQ